MTYFEFLTESGGGELHGATTAQEAVDMIAALYADAPDWREFVSLVEYDGDRRRFIDITSLEVSDWEDW